MLIGMHAFYSGRMQLHLCMSTIASLPLQVDLSTTLAAVLCSCLKPGLLLSAGMHTG